MSISTSADQSCLVKSSDSEETRAGRLLSLKVSTIEFDHLWLRVVGQERIFLFTISLFVPY